MKRERYNIYRYIHNVTGADARSALRTLLLLDRCTYTIVRFTTAKKNPLPRLTGKRWEARL